MSEQSNVIVLKPRAREAPTLRLYELRLEDGCGIEASVMDSDGNIVAMYSFDLVYVTPGFGPELFRAVWNELRDGSAAAS